MEEESRYELLLTLDYVLKYCKALNLELLSYETCLGILPSTENDEKIIRELSPIEIELFLVSGTLGKELIEASAKEDSPNWKYNTMSAIHEVCMIWFMTTSIIQTLEIVKNVLFGRE